MAHECPTCGSLCHCGGDIDDCQFSGTRYELMCKHCDEEKPMSEEAKPELVYTPALAVEIRVEGKAVLKMDRGTTIQVRPIRKHEKEIRQVIAWLNEIVGDGGAG